MKLVTYQRVIWTELEIGNKNESIGVGHRERLATYSQFDAAKEQTSE